ncbi:MAG: MBL fold metallo-hydrolase [Acidobacteria bacterium]|nr:MBL fold metallo-hydrolase [Acidobacteriota bacterium]
MSLHIFRSIFAAAATIAAAVAFSWPEVAAQTPTSGDVTVLPVQGAVSVLFGPGGPNNSTSANITVQASEDAVVLVDTGREDASGQFIAAIRRISTRPVRFIINTQAGRDHTGGNEALSLSGRPYGGRAAGAGFLLPGAADGATIIAHEHVLAVLSGLRGSPAVPFRAHPTETYFAPEHELFNHEAIQIFHEPAALTDGDSVVFFRRSDVISAGDVFSTVTYPRIDPRAGGTVNGTISALNHIIDLAIPREKQEGGTYIIPGHGRIADEADVVEYRDMIVIIRDRVQDLMTKGRTLDQIKAAKVPFDYDRRYSKPEWTGEQFVESIFATLPRTTNSASR